MDQLAAVMLRRCGRVGLQAGPAPVADGPEWVAALEADLARSGWLLQRELRDAAASIPARRRTQWADWLLATVDELVGADRPLIPLYRGFPLTPRDTGAVYRDRLLTHL